jgi:hypothetical protein
MVRLTAAVDGKTFAYSERSTGTTSATAAGDFVTLTFLTENKTSSGELVHEELDKLWIKGVKLTVVVGPFGDVKECNILPSGSADGEKPRSIDPDLRDIFLSELRLPEIGFHQDQSGPMKISLPRKGLSSSTAKASS